MKVDGDKLKSVRESKLLTLDEVAEKAGVKKDTIWRIEAKKTVNPKEDVLRKLAEVFGMKPEEFSAAVKAGNGQKR